MLIVLPSVISSKKSASTEKCSWASALIQKQIGKNAATILP